MDTIHSSNANSSLISTLERVTDAEVNPFVYSVGKYIPSHAAQKLRILPNQQMASENAVSTFEVPKLGYLSAATLSFDVLFNSAIVANGDENRFPIVALHGRGLLQMIRRIEWCNENRTILTLTQDAIMAMYSDLSYEARVAFSKSVMSPCDPLESMGSAFSQSASDGTRGRMSCHMPILMSLFANSKLMPNVQFLAPCQLKIHWSSSFDIGYKMYTVASVANANFAGTTTVGGTAEFPASFTGFTVDQGSVRLTSDLISLPQQLSSATIEKNFASSGSLSQLVYDCEQLNPVKVLLPTSYDGEFPTISVPINTNKCLSAIYVMLYVDKDGVEAPQEPTVDSRISNTAIGLPMQVDEISLSASGQVIVEPTPAEEFSCWGRRTLEGTNGGFWATNACLGGGFRNRLSQPLATHFSVGGTPEGPTSVFSQVANTFTPQAAVYDSLNSRYIYKINLNSLSSDKNYNAGMVSARELSALTLDVKLQKPFTSANYAAGAPIRGSDYPTSSRYVPAGANGADQRLFPTTDYRGTNTTNNVTATLSVVLLTHSIVNCDGQSGRVTGLLSN